MLFLAIIGRQDENTVLKYKNGNVGASFWNFSASAEAINITVDLLRFYTHKFDMEDPLFQAITK